MQIVIHGPDHVPFFPKITSNQMNSYTKSRSFHRSTIETTFRICVCYSDMTIIASTLKNIATTFVKDWTGTRIRSPKLYWRTSPVWIKRKWLLTLNRRKCSKWPGKYSNKKLVDCWDIHSVRFKRFKNIPAKVSHRRCIACAHKRSVE